MPLTRELAAFCSALRHADVPAGALPFIRTGFTDTVGTMVAGRTSEPAVTLRRTLEAERGASRVFFDQGTAHAPEAAWLNATAAHALDFDDAAQKGHISAVLVPAILAEAEVLRADGRAMVTAYAAGYEVWAELFRRERDLHHNHAWHPTGTFGPVAAAAACASLRGLGATQAAHALATAASQASGLIANFGSMTKPFHAGRAAHAGVLAARLAKNGFTGSDEAIEHPKGLLAAISPHRNVDLESPSEAGRVWKLPVAGLNTKKYPTCFATHRALDGMLWLKEQHGLQPAQVRRVSVTTSRRNKGTLRFGAPTDGLQAKFSMEFAMASVLAAGRCSLLELRDEFVRRDDVRALMQRVDVVPEDREDANRPGEAPQDVVAVQLDDGRTLVKEVEYVRGGPELPLAPGELFSKFETCLAYGQLAEDPRRLFDTLMAVDELPSVQAIYA
jgi:2-methylcitrate dehydratase PrpD